jgi:signal peptidase I
VTTIIAADRGPIGRHRKEPSRRGAGGFRGAAVVAARWTGLTLVLAAAVLLVLAHVLGWSAMIVSSDSMEPGVPVGSLVLAQRVSWQDVRVGDAIAVQSTGGSRPVTVLHRVVALNERDGRRFAEFKGDADGTPDPEAVALTQPVDRSVVVVPRAGDAMSTARAVAQPSRLLIIGAGLLGLWLIRGAGRRRRRRGPIHARSRGSVE